MLEAGAAWGSNVYNHLIDRWHKRNRDAVHNYNPDLIDGQLLEQLYAQHGADLTRGKPRSRDELVEGAFGVAIGRLPRALEAHELDDFAAAGIERAEDIRDRLLPAWSCRSRDRCRPERTFTRCGRTTRFKPN